MSDLDNPLIGNSWDATEPGSIGCMVVVLGWLATFAAGIIVGHWFL